MKSGDKPVNVDLIPLTNDEAEATTGGAERPPDIGGTGPGMTRPRAPHSFGGMSYQDSNSGMGLDDTDSG